MESINENVNMVEDAPTEVDLDTLLGMSDELESAGSVDMEMLGEDNEEIDLPHIKVPTKRIVDVLKISALLSQGGKMNTEAKSIGFEVRDGYLYTYLVDKAEGYVEKRIELLNTENIFEGFFAVSGGVLSKMIKACSSVFTIIKKEDGIYLKMMGGEALLDTINLKKEGMVFPNVSKLFFSEVNKEEFCNSVKMLYSLATNAVTPAQKRIFFKGSTVYSACMFCAAKVDGENNYGEYSILVKEAKMLYLLASGDPCETMKIAEEGNVIIGDSFKFKFAKSAYKAQRIMDIVDRMFGYETANADVQHLMKIAELSSGLEYSTCRLMFNYNEEGRVVVVMETKRKNSEFVLRGAPSEGVTKLEKSVTVQANLLKDLLTVYNQESTVFICISEDGLALQGGGYKAIICTDTAGI